MTEKSSQTVYVAYVRTATSDPASITAQQALLSDFVTANGGTIVAEFADVGSSGHDLDRRGLREMMVRLSNGDVDAVLVAEPSRLGRGRAYLVAEYEVAGLGVRVEPASRQVPAPGMEMPGNYQLFNLIWPEATNRVTQTKLTKMAAEGYFTGGKVPFGFRSETVPEVIGYSKPPKRLMVDEAVSPIIRNAFELYMKHRSVGAPQDFLNAETSEAWSRPRTRRFLTNLAYEPIVGGVVFQEVQRLVLERTIKRKK